ncbi:MAG TPA: phosphoribulokinase [Candidatus Limnocylindrales bacterium]|nr:phosphoribulokinase [Candidatus Limnocylindrales bacterium]
MGTASRSGRQRPIFVAIGGDSGSGKSTLTAGFYRIFPRDRITTVCLDDYHSLDRRERALVGITALNPRANNFALMENQLLALKRGHTISKPVYDHRDGTFGQPEELQAKEVVIVQGLHPFLVPGVRGLFDLRVWLDPEDELKRKWKVQRDVAKRGYTEAQVRAEIAARQPDAAAYIAPQRSFADLVVRFFRMEKGGSDEHLSVRITERESLPRLNLDGLLGRAEQGLRALRGTDDGRTADILEIDGTIDRVTVRHLEDRIWDHIDARHQHLRHLAPDQFGDFQDGVMHTHHSDPLALVQLLLVHRILSAKKSVLLKVPLSLHESMIHAHQQEEEIAHDHEHV